VATVRHSTCRIDFDPADVTGMATIRVSDSDGVELDTIEIRTTHLVGVVTKLMMVQTRRHVALARMIGEMDDEISETGKPLHQVEAGMLRHAKVCGTVGHHISSSCTPIPTVS
jgi:hypothetical protein